MSFYLPFKWLYSFIFALLPELPSSCQNAVRPLLASRETCVPKEGVFSIDGSQLHTIGVFGTYGGIQLCSRRKAATAARFVS